MQGFARNDKGDGQQDQADTRSKPRSEQFTEDITPITTAVSGSKAPITAVGVEPMACTATVINTSERP